MDLETFPDLGERAPIKEALIDIYCSLPESMSLAELRKLHEQIASEYPNVRARKLWQAKLEMKDFEIKSTEQSAADGWLFESADNLDIVQFRVNGFTVNRLRPYCGWDRLYDTAKRLWETYRSGASPVTIQRVGVRYLNRFELPDGADLDEYFTISPRLPTGTTAMNDFLVRLVAPDAETGGTAEIICAVDKTAELSGTSILLDIGAYRTLDRSLQTAEIWDTLSVLRDLKNRMFFGSLTDRSRAMLQGATS